MDRPNFKLTPPAQAPAPTTSTPPAAAPGADPVAKHAELTRRYESLKENRMRRSVQLQQAQEEDARCRQEAAAFGAQTPEELEAILERKRQETLEALATFEKQLDEEASLQARIEQDLAAIESR